MDLFSELEQQAPREFKKHSLQDGEVWVMKNFMSPTEARKYFKILNDTINWKQEEITFYGKTHPVPRKTAWYGDEGVNYTYSGISCNPDPWTSQLMDIKKDIESFMLEDEVNSVLHFNSVLLNLYRDGNDKVGWHADDEKDLGVNPTIASLSLGTARFFDLKHKDNPALKMRIELTPGSLVIMTGELQHHWLHQIPVQKKVKEARINLTFRTIVS
jgi:alkylated DNA repair dioxygenase AlkB